MRGADPAEILSVLGNSHSGEILVATEEPRSVQELSDELEIPIASCYRRVHELTDHGLLEFVDPHARETTYQRTVDGLYVDFATSLSISATRPRRVQTKLDQLWQPSH